MLFGQSSTARPGGHIRRGPSLASGWIRLETIRQIAGAGAWQMASTLAQLNC
jgi:hypothetical protein